MRFNPPLTDAQIKLASKVFNTLCPSMDSWEYYEEFAFVKAGITLEQAMQELMLLRAMFPDNNLEGTIIGNNDKGLAWMVAGININERYKNSVATVFEYANPDQKITAKTASFADIYGAKAGVNKTVTKKLGPKVDQLQEDKDKEILLLRATVEAQRKMIADFTMNGLGKPKSKEVKEPEEGSINSTTQLAPAPKGKRHFILTASKDFDPKTFSEGIKMVVMGVESVKFSD